MKYTMRSAEEKAEFVRRWHASGLSLTRFSRMHGVSPSSLRQWSGGLPQSTLATTPFVEVELVGPQYTPALVVEVAGSGHRVVVPGGFDAGELRRLVAALC